MTRTWFSADTHFGHANIIKYCNRPFKNVHEMNVALIRGWNERVKPDDTVYFLGDFSFKSNTKSGNGLPYIAEHYYKQLNGNIIFIKGNHDNNNKLKTHMTRAILEMCGMKMHLSHRPEDADKKYNLNLCGHVHNSFKSKKVGKSVIMNVGVDVWDFKPVSILQIMKEYRKVLK